LYSFTSNEKANKVRWDRDTGAKTETENVKTGNPVIARVYESLKTHQLGF